MVATAVVLLCTLASAPHKAEVTFNEPPARLESLLASLSKSTGFRLSCSRDLADRILYIEVQDARLDELKDHIAYVLDAKWEEREQRSLLVVDNETLDARRAKLQGRYVTDVKKGFSDLQKELPEKLTDEIAQMAVQEIRDLTDRTQEFSQERFAELQKRYSIAPAARLAAQLIERLLNDSPEDLPLFKAGRVVFTNLRNSAYDKITVDSKLLKEYDSAQILWDKIAEQYEATSVSRWSVSSTMKASSSFRPSKTLFLMVNKPSQFSRFEVSIAVLDDQGEYKAGAEVFFKNPIEQTRYEATWSVSLEGKKITLSQEATRYVKATDRASRPPVHIPSGDPLYTKVIDPVKYDPLGFGLGEIVSQSLSNLGVQIVAELLDDELILTLIAAREQGLTVRDALNNFQTRNEAEIVEHDDGFVTMRYRNPDKHLDNFPRESLKAIAQSFDKLGYVDLKTLVEHGFPFRSIAFQSLNRWVPASMIRFLSPGYYYALATFNQSMPRYANVLTQAERDALLTGRPLLFGRLTSTSKRRLNNLLIAGIDVYGQDVPSGNARAPRDLQAVLVFPYGLTDDTILQIEAETIAGIAALVTPDTEYASDYIIGSERGGTHGIGVRLATTKEPPQFWLGRYLTGSFVLKRGGETLIRYQVNLPMIDVRGKALSLTDLSEDFRKKIEVSRQLKIKAMEAGYDGPIPPPN